MKTQVDFDIRSYVAEDEERVLDLLEASLGGGPGGRITSDFLRWKHHDNPFGSSFMLIAEAGDRIAGLRAFMRWQFQCEGRVIRAVRAVDTATHPDFQRMGLFTRLTLEALERLRGDTDLVFNTPNEKSLPGYLKMGWQELGRLPISVRVKRPLRFARDLRSIGGSQSEEASTHAAGGSLSATEVLADNRLPELVSAQEIGDRFATLRTPDFLRWRYSERSGLSYRAVADTVGEELRGVAIFRVRPRGKLTEATITELLAHPGDLASAKRLLKSVIDATAVDHLVCSFPAPPARIAAQRKGFVRAPGGLTVVVNPLTNALSPDPTRWDSWAFGLGDLEVF